MDKANDRQRDDVMNNTDPQLEPTERQRLEMAGDDRAIRGDRAHCQNGIAAMAPAYRHGLFVEMDNLIASQPNVDVVIRYDGVAKQFTYVEFLRACGFVVGHTEGEKE